MTQTYFRYLPMIFFALSLHASIPSVTHAAAAPTCSLSFSQATIQKGQSASWYLEVNGFLNKVTHTRTGVLSYQGNSSFDYTTLPADSANLRDRNGYTTGPAQIRPMTVGEGTHTVHVTGPGGSNSCTAKINVTSNEAFDADDTVMVPNPVTYTLNNTEEMLACPATACGITVWRSYDGIGTITRKNADWYFLSVKNNAGNGSYTTQGWLESNQLPENIMQELQNANPSLFENNAEEIIPEPIHENQKPTPSTPMSILEFFLFPFMIMLYGK